MPTPIDPKRLPGLKKALGEFGEGDWAAQKQLADLYGVANSRFSTLTKNRFPNFPDPERRGDKTFWYPARAAVASMIQYMEDQARGRDAQARRHSAVMNSVDQARDEAEPEKAPLTATELDRLASARTKIWRLAKEQGQYTLTLEVEQLARGMMSLFNREVMNLVNELDPNGEMTPGQRERLKNKCRDIVLKLRDKAGRFLEDDDDVGRAPGTAIARGGTGGDLPRRRVRGGGRSMGTAA